jgi:hypothetical protein
MVLYAYPDCDYPGPLVCMLRSASTYFESVNPGTSWHPRSTCRLLAGPPPPLRLPPNEYEMLA